MGQVVALRRAVEPGETNGVDRISNCSFAVAELTDRIKESTESIIEIESAITA